MLKSQGTLISKPNCRMVNGVKICDDCHAYQKSNPKGNPPVTTDPSKKKCWTRASDCPSGTRIAYYSDGTCNCVSCPTCVGSSQPVEDTPCENSTNTSYDLSCPESVKKGESATCTCKVIEENTCYDGGTSTNSISINSDVCGKTLVKCGDKESYVDITCPACYRKKIGSGQYDYKWSNGVPESGYVKVDGIDSETDCILKNPTIPNKCISVSHDSSKSKSVNVCDENVSMPLDSMEVCSDSITNQFYKINCRETINAKFDPKNLKIKAGQGFKFNIQVTSTQTCSGAFDVNSWNTSYNNAKAGYDRATNKTKDIEEQKWYQNILNTLIGIKDNYNNLVNDYLNAKGNNSIANVDGKLELKYLYNSGKQNGTLVKKFDKESFSTKAKLLSKKEVLLSNNFKVIDFNVEINSSINLVPPVAYIDKNTGQEVSSSSKDALNGGRQFLTELKMDKNTVPYKINIKLSNLGSNLKSSISNDKCGLTVINDSNDIYYRIISIKSPFGISQEPGINWSNTNYNFMDVIDANTWSNRNLYKFSLSGEDIDKIKNSNKVYSDIAYDGLCERDNSITLNSSDQKICFELSK